MKANTSFTSFAGNDRPARSQNSVEASQGPSRDEIAQRAYTRWESEGCQHGRDQDYWLAAERELRDEASFRTSRGTGSREDRSGDLSASSSDSSSGAERRSGRSQDFSASSASSGASSGRAESDSSSRDAGSRSSPRAGNSGSGRSGSNAPFRSSDSSKNRR